MIGEASRGPTRPLRPVRPVVSQRELAGWVGSSREAVNQALQQLHRQGYITAERRQITVLDVEGLRGRAS